MRTARGLFIFILIFILIPWGLIFTLRLVGRRRGYDNLIAPPQDELLNASWEWLRVLVDEVHGQVS